MRPLIQTGKRYLPSAAAYFLVGGSCALIEWGMFYLVHTQEGLNYFLAAFAGFVVATFANWVLSSSFVFRSAGRSRREEVVLVYAVSGVGFGINLAVMTTLIELVGVPAMPAKVTGTGVAFVWNYVARQFFVFDRRTHRLERFVVPVDPDLSGAVSETPNT